MSMGGGNHPPSCRICHGTGWHRGPDVPVHAINGQPIRNYSTVQPCTHHWIDDEHHHDPLISLDEYLHRHPEDTHLFTRR